MLCTSVASGARYSELKYYVTDVPFFFSDDIHALLSFHYFFVVADFNIHLEFSALTYTLNPVARLFTFVFSIS